MENTKLIIVGLICIFMLVANNVSSQRIHQSGTMENRNENERSLLKFMKEIISVLASKILAVLNSGGKIIAYEIYGKHRDGFKSLDIR